ncbi:MAG: DUF2884 family protein [Calditrichaeota bacterium]|nr:MAG: DUF2884 family protein [Calditrichota bacterium]
MQKLLISLFIVVSIFSQSFAIGGKKGSSYDKVQDMEFLNLDCDLDFDDDRNVTFKNDGSEVKFTSDNEIFIDGEKIKLNSKQKRLVGEFNETFLELLEKVKDIGLEGVELGKDGVELGLEAVSGAFEAMFSDSELEDVEADLEKKANELEVKGEILEKKAKALEKVGDHLKDMKDEIKDKVPELGKLDWF